MNNLVSVRHSLRLIEQTGRMLIFLASDEEPAVVCCLGRENSLVLSLAQLLKSQR